MKTSVFKLTVRSVRTFFGRYMALLLIVAVSVGFFAGLRITQDAMIDTADEYFEDQHFYDFRVFSTLGFTEEDVRELSGLSGVERAEGMMSVDALIKTDGTDQPMKLMSLPNEVNIPSLSCGRLPQSAGECLADDERFTEEDIGRTLTLSDANADGTSEQLALREYKIVGTVDSPIYLGMDRGTADIGTGALYSFLYLPADCFVGDVYTEISLTLEQTAKIYSDEYDEIVGKYEAEVTKTVKELADRRYSGLLADITVPPDLAALGVSAEQLAERFGLYPAQTFVLTREENAGYVSFENDTAIVSGVANIFPVFFILIAMLVCITTMTRMVDEERTQIGVLKSMGFGNASVMAKYLLYAGSATLIGWAVGFFLCTWGLPLIFWFAYGAIYNFAPLNYLFSPLLALLTLAISLCAILGATYICCQKELRSRPAALIRPRAAKSGRRILLERITPLWRRLPFLTKIITRNMFRYKRRLVMMLVGIGCCAGLVVTAFGVRDSMINIASLQFDGIQHYEIEAAFDEGAQTDVEAELDALDSVEKYQLAAVRRVDLEGEVNINSVSLMSFSDTDGLSDFWTFSRGGEDVPLPDRGEALVCSKIAEKLGLRVGSSVTVKDADLNTHTVIVSGVFENYINNYVVISGQTYSDMFGEWQANTVMASVGSDSEAAALALTESEHITSVSRLENTRNNIDDALSCLNYIIWLVVGFSGALAFIVTFNLTNINLAERSREIATVEVLGFYRKETNSYVLRENLILSVIASVIGLPLGTLFHRIVMSMIRIDMLAFATEITPLSYLISVICTVLFALIVNLFMRRHIRKIRMAESLKAVE